MKCARTPVHACARMRGMRARARGTLIQHVHVAPRDADTFVGLLLLLLLLFMVLLVLLSLLL